MDLALAEGFKILYIASIALGLLAALNLYTRAIGNQYANKVVALFVLLLILPLLVGYSTLSILSLPASIIKISHKISWLYGPSIYLLIQIVLNRVPRNQWFFSLHALPFLLFSFSILVGWYTESVWIAIATFSQVGIYSYLTFRLIVFCRRQIVLLFIGHKRCTLYWVGLLFIGALTVMNLEAIAIYAYLAWGGLDQVVRHCFLVIPSLYVMTIALLLLFQSDTPAFDGLDSLSEVDKGDCQNSGVRGERPNTQQKELKELSLDSAVELAEKLRLFMQIEKPYLRNDYSLNDLAKSLSISTHQLSELLNIYVGNSFYEYINKARFEHAKQLLTDPNKKQTILDVAYESGFNNKSTFYKVFKQYANKTPKVYRDSLSS